MTLEPVAVSSPAYPGHRDRRGLRDLVVALAAIPVTVTLCAALLLAAPATARAEDTSAVECVPPAPCSGEVAPPDVRPPCLGRRPALPVRPAPLSPDTVGRPCPGAPPPPCRGKIALPDPAPDPGPPPCAGVVMPVPVDLPAPEPPGIFAVAPDPAAWKGLPVDLAGTLERDGKRPGRYAIVAERPGKDGRKERFRVPLTLDGGALRAAGVRVGGPIRAKGTLQVKPGAGGAGEFTLGGATLTPGN